MRTATVIILVVLAIAATIGPALYEGNRAFRWGTDTTLDRYIERMNSFPDQIGNWKQVDELRLDAAARDQLQPFATISRTYSDGEHLVHVFVLLGPIGPTAVHTPDICFNSRNFTTLKDRIIFPSNNGKTKSGSQFWQIDFKSKGLEAATLRNWYAWTLNGKWQASRNPRFEFAAERVLFKIQIAIAYPTIEAMNSDTSGPEFLQQFEQRLATTLFQ